MLFAFYFGGCYSDILVYYAIYGNDTIYREFPHSGVRFQIPHKNDNLDPMLAHSVARDLGNNTCSAEVYAQYIAPRGIIAMYYYSFGTDRMVIHAFSALPASRMAGCDAATVRYCTCRGAFFFFFRTPDWGRKLQNV